MLFPEEEAVQLKKWIVKRLENTSDADADVLADYVLALLRHDGDVETVRQLCEAEIPDFLKEDSSVFVNDVFEAIQHRSYMPGVAPPPAKRSGPAYPLSGAPPAAFPGVRGAPGGLQNGGSRKRSYNDAADTEMQNGRDSHYGGGDINGRSFKQPRRGGRGDMGNGGRGDFADHGRGRGNHQFRGSSLHSPGGMHDPRHMSNPNMPSPGFDPSTIPGFDPNNPMATLLAMQAMMPMPMLPQDGSRGPQGSPPLPGQGGFPKKQNRCRDYDTKGFCNRGNNCRFSHGDDSIYVPPGVDVQQEYDPLNPMAMTGMEGFPPNSGPFNSGRGGGERGRGRGRGGRGDSSGPARRGGRYEFSSDRPNHDKSKTAIVVENIPEESFSEDAVREFFSEFGTILSIDMKPYKRLAIVKYSDWNEAKAAYSSPKVIFDNRFVKVYWFSNEESLPQAPGGGEKRDVNMEDGGPAPARPSNEPQIDIEEFKRKQEEAQRVHQEKMKKKAEMETAQKELERRQEELLKAQAEEKRKLMERIAAKSGKLNPATNTGSGTATDTSGTGTPSQSDALKIQLAALEAEAKSLGLNPAAAAEDQYLGMNYRGRGRGRGEYRGRAAFVPRGARGGYRGRGGAPPYAGPSANPYKLDNRPKKIALTGIDFEEAEKNESLRQYLLGIGEFVAIDATRSKTSITFKDRFTAEKFMYGAPNGELPSIGKVDMAWVQTPLPPVDLSKFGDLSKLATSASNGGGSANGGQPQGVETDGDAMMQDLGNGSGGKQGGDGGGGAERQQDLDYDVADDWS